MQKKKYIILKSLAYTLTSNFVSLLVSVLVVLVVPKLVSVKAYGYWQLYLFYASYVGFMHIGWIDGIYLRYGGKEYSELDKGLFFSQFCLFLLFQIILFAFIAASTSFQADDGDRFFILQMIGICMLLTNVRHMFLTILQITYRIKEYAQITIVGRLLFFGLMALILALGSRDYKLMIVADLTGRLASMVLALYFCREILFARFSSFTFDFQEVFQNISSGSKLMFANIAGMLIVGTVRFGIERTWNVETFGRVSLALSLTNFSMIFINAVGLVLFPILRRTNPKRLRELFVVLRDLLVPFLLGMLLLSFPLVKCLEGWLPQYYESLVYVGLLFPIFVYEAKMDFLINTFLKVLRQEKSMLMINLLSFGLSLLVTFVTTFWLKDLHLAVASIVFLLMFRGTVAEILISRTLSVGSLKGICLELVLVFAFMSSVFFIGKNTKALLCYLAVYLLYLLIRRKELVLSLQKISLFAAS